MRFDTLDAWLRWQETLNPREIDLGLERVRPVAERLDVAAPPFRAVIVAGTNGKGSCVAYLESLLRTAGQHVGAYTSPHLTRYNERIRIAGEAIDDAALCAAFDRVDRARGDIPLTYFEFGTLAALDCFRQAGVETAVLEVGMGGRLDAVNLVDADVAVITSIDIDHSEWLGPDRERIGHEKAGVLRRDRPGVCADRQPPDSVSGYARKVGAALSVLGRDFEVVRHADDSWTLQAGSRRWGPLAPPPIPGSFQYDNAAAAVFAFRLLDQALDDEKVAEAIAATRLAGRLDLRPGQVDILFDVGHNREAVTALAQHIQSLRHSGRVFAVAGMMRDKQVEPAVQAMAKLVDRWFAAGLPPPRGLSGAELQGRLVAAGVSASSESFATPAAALAAASEAAEAGDLIVIFGSFITVGEAMRRCRLS